MEIKINTGNYSDEEAEKYLALGLMRYIIGRAKAENRKLAKQHKTKEVINNFLTECIKDGRIKSLDIEAHKINEEKVNEEMK